MSSESHRMIRIHGPYHGLTAWPSHDLACEHVVWRLHDLAAACHLVILPSVVFPQMLWKQMLIWRPVFVHARHVVFEVPGDIRF